MSSAVLASRPPARAGRRLAVVLAAAMAAAAPPAAAQPLPELELELVADGLPQVTAITHADDARLFVALQSGVIRVVRDGQLLPQPFLDLRERVTNAGEQGLLGLAFHPNHKANGWFFVNYIDRDGDTVVSRFRASEPLRADPASERVLLHIDQPFANHNGGQLAFGLDGKLYVSTGDGGSANDPHCNAQDRSNLLGKILRLDVDAGSAMPPHHRVPPDNPFVGQGTSRGEIWHYGLRNPWRFSFDRETGDLFVADVGQSEMEEVSFLPFGAPGGANFGWKVMEGTFCTNLRGGCTVSLPPCFSPELVAPILTYPNGGGECAVTGGFVYRGPAIAWLQGQYLYGDFCSGRLFRARRQSVGWVSRELPFRAPLLQTFGEDAAGEVYLGTNGRLLKLVSAGEEPEPDPEPEPEPCVADADTLCLGPDGRFRVEATFVAGGEPPRPAGTRPITGDTGALWFFDAANLELIVKVLDACVPFERFWVFAAGLTDVEVELTVEDSVTGTTRRYLNAAGTPFQPVQDTGAFATCGASP